MAEPTRKQIGLIGLFDDPDALIRAARIVRDAGYTKWDCHTPYPLHGLDKAMGLRPSLVPVVTIAAAFVGLAVALALTGGLSVWHYPIRIGGKPLFSWPAFVPIYFEMFVLFAALATMGAIVRFCRLGRWRSPLHDTRVMKDVTCDRLAIVLDGQDRQYAEDQARRLLEDAGCRDVRPLVELVEEDQAFI